MPDWVATELERLRVVYGRTGDLSLVPRAVLLCLCFGLRRQWVAGAYRRAYQSWDAGDVRLFDEAFKLPSRKGQWIKGARDRRELKLRAYARVLALHEGEGCPINQKTFERVGKEEEVEWETIKGRYYEAKALMDSLPPNCQIVYTYTGSGGVRIRGSAVTAFIPSK